MLESMKTRRAQTGAESTTSMALAFSSPICWDFRSNAARLSHRCTRIPQIRDGGKGESRPSLFLPDPCYRCSSVAEFDTLRRAFYDHLTCLPNSRQTTTIVLNVCS